MKFVTASMLMLAVLPLAVDAKRRRVPFMVCPSTKSNSGLVTVHSARSKIECSIICLNDPDCLSASYCKNPDGYTCQLSSFYAAGTCAGLLVDGDCTQTAMMYPCENGGTFFLETRTCHCVEGFVGDYCQRRYRDCQETPVAGVMYTIQPFRSDCIFQWFCGPGMIVNYTVISHYVSSRTYNYTYPWEQIKHGITPHPGYFFTGLENLHQLTEQGVYDLFVRMVVWGKAKGWVIYKNFRVDSEAEGYACHWDSFARINDIYYNSDEYLDGLGALGDSTKSMNGTRFGTFDKDVNGCASANYDFPWWYNPIGCSLVAFEPHGFYWPTNRNGTAEMEKIDFVIIGLTNKYWHFEDDLIL